MKKILSILFLFISASAFAQKMPDMGLNKIRITEPDKTIVAEIDEVISNPAAKPALFYFWYSANMIHSTQGGFRGALLNGLYTEYYLNKNLKEQGNFKKGLKDGTWKSWMEDGMLRETVTWKKGIVVIKTSSKKFWQNVHFFKKKAKRDSVAKPRNP